MNSANSNEGSLRDSYMLNFTIDLAWLKCFILSNYLNLCVLIHNSTVANSEQRCAYVGCVSCTIQTWTMHPTRNNEKISSKLTIADKHRFASLEKTHFIACYIRKMSKKIYEIFPLTRLCCIAVTISFMSLSSTLSQAFYYKFTPRTLLSPVS